MSVMLLFSAGCDARKLNRNSYLNDLDRVTSIQYFPSDGMLRGAVPVLHTLT